MKKDQQASHLDEEVTLKDILLKIREYISVLGKYRNYIFLLGIIFMVFSGIRAKVNKAEYKAKLTFMINQDNGNSLGSIGGMLGNFGFNTKGKNNIARVLELSGSRRIVDNTLFKTYDLSGSKDLLANHLINYFDSTDQWNHKAWYSFWSKTDDSLNNFRFVHLDKNTFSPTEKLSNKILYEKIAGSSGSIENAMLKTGFNEDSRIMQLSINSLNPELSILLVNALFDELSSFYIDKSTEKQKNTYSVLKIKTDSIQNVLERKEKQLASLEDSWLGSYSKKSALRRDKLNKEIKLMNIALGEIIRNLEIADFALKNTTPYVQIIDRPDYPLDAIKDSWVKSAIWGFLVGIFLFSLLLFFRKFYRDALKSI